MRVVAIVLGSLFLPIGAFLAIAGLVFDSHSSDGEWSCSATTSGSTCTAPHLYRSQQATEIIVAGTGLFVAGAALFGGAAASSRPRQFPAYPPAPGGYGPPYPQQQGGYPPNPA